MKDLTQILEESMTWELIDMILSSPKKTQDIKKIRLRPVVIKDVLYYQAAAYTKTQVFHENIKQDQIMDWAKTQIQNVYKQTQIILNDKEYQILSGKKGNVTIKCHLKKEDAATAKPKKITSGNAKTDVNGCAPCEPDLSSLAHNRVKRYILPEGTPVPFLVDLGVMTKTGEIVKKRYDKYRQINRFLEFIRDILPELPKDRTINVIDFGCGKSYLTFAMYYYLHELEGRDVNMTGLDLKKDVIDHCRKLADAYGYEGLHFLCGDIAEYEGADSVDLMVTLHACDTATDYALYKAIRWQAGVILSVPCCQHELNKQIENEMLAPVFSYGILKERMAALITDGMRGQLLEACGYRTQLLEFIDMEHTPKNILIRAVRKGKKSSLKQYETVALAMHGDLTLYKLLTQNAQE